MYLVEMVFGGMGGKNAGDAGIEAAAEYGQKALFAEAVLIGPLPAILELRLFFGFVVGRIQVVYAGFEAGVHDGEVLVRQGHVDDELRAEGADELNQFGHVLRIDRGGLHFLMAGIAHGVADNLIALDLVRLASIISEKISGC
jgi:hypothetical protein